jgi:hypothetical protein
MLNQDHLIIETNEFQDGINKKKSEMVILCDHRLYKLVGFGFQINLPITKYTRKSNNYHRFNSCFFFIVIIDKIASCFYELCVFFSIRFET